MDFARAKIHSLVAVAQSVGEMNMDYADPELLKFREVETRFLRQFNMPKEERLVNCKYMCIVALLFLPVWRTQPLHHISRNKLEGWPGYLWWTLPYSITMKQNIKQI